jgi:hypothetical protein
MDKQKPSCPAGKDGFRLEELLYYCFFSVLLVEPLELDAPPAAESFFVASADEEALEDGELGVVVPDAELDEELESFFDMSTDAEPEAEPEGELGVVVEPEEDEEPAGGVVRETVRSPSLSQPVSNPAPSARDTATARVESLMLWASVVGVSVMEQGSGPSR